jgi:short-subunit dehydrogenase
MNNENNKNEKNEKIIQIISKNNINKSNLLNINITNPTKILTLLGALIIMKKLINLSFWIKKYLLIREKNFIKDYGNGWTLITGASKGLGKSYAKKFYSKGNNLLLIARNEEDLKSSIEELRKNNTQKNHVEYILYDFSEDYTQENLDFLEKNLEKYEINILINNIGKANLNYFEKFSDEEIYDSVNLNIFSSIFLTKIILKKMKKRRLRSLIVFIGSDLIDYSPPFLQIYTACKNFNFSFAKSLPKETNKIDFTYVNPGPLENTSNKRENFFKINSDDFAENSMRHFGEYENTYGHYLFAFKNFIFGNDLVRRVYTDKSLKKEFNPTNNKL